MSVSTHSSTELEYQRIKKLSELDLDYYNLKEEFNVVVSLAASIAGTEYSYLNLIDNFTQWPIASHGIEFNQMPKEESVCYHTIQKKIPLEIARLDKDERFSDKYYVKRQDGLKYYLGIPLTLDTGENIGALCVLDSQEKSLPEEKILQLELIAIEIVNKFDVIKKMNDLEAAVTEAEKSKKRLAHDIRSPLSGITGLCEVVREEDISPNDFQSYLEMINKSGNGIFDITNEILEKKQEDDTLKAQTFNLEEFSNSLSELYTLPAKAKQLNFIISISEKKGDIRFSRRRLLSVVGNVLSNAIKFTPIGGRVKVDLKIAGDAGERILRVVVMDNGVGVKSIVPGGSGVDEIEQTPGTNGEKGFGLGLRLVNEAVKERNGSFEIGSGKDGGTEVKIEVPID